MAGKRSYDKTIIIGRLGNDPVLEHGKSVELKSQVMKLSAVMDYTVLMISSTTFQDGEEHVTWNRIVAVEKQARTIAEHLQKGDLCCIEGSIIVRGDEPVIKAERITFLSSRRRNSSEDNKESSDEN